MNLINMDGKFDCGAAVLAMTLGLQGARSVYPMLGYDPNDTDAAGVGVSEEELLGVLATCHIGYTRFISLECMACAQGVPVAGIARRVKVPSEHELQCRLAAHKGLSIVSVPKLGDTSYVPGHFVLVEGNVVYDPALKKRYIGDAYSLPVCSVIFLQQPKNKYVFASGSPNPFNNGENRRYFALDAKHGN